MERDEVLPLNGPNQNLDDLANVQDFNSIGKRNELYCFKLTQNGMYIREPICTDLPSESRYEIDIILKNNMVICKGDSNVVNRIINSGSMFGNFVSDNKTILRKINKSYYIGNNSNDNDLTILNFKTQFPEDLKLLTNPPKESEFIIEGVLLDSFDNELELLKGLFVKVEDSLTISEIPFQIIITKNEENFNIKSFPEELIGNNSNDNDLTILNFKTQFPEDLKLLTNPP